MSKFTIFSGKVRQRARLRRQAYRVQICQRRSAALLAKDPALKRFAETAQPVSPLESSWAKERIFALACEIQDLQQALLILQRGLRDCAAET